MKKIFGIAMIFMLGASISAFAQSKVDKGAQGVKKGATKAWEGTKKGAKKAGNETAQQASKAKARVTDKKSTQWVGPQGQTIYVDNGSKYYWINGNGKRIYVSEAALKARQK